MDFIKIGDAKIFALEYVFLDEHKTTELCMFVNKKNILAFTRDGVHLTTRWNLDELVEWLRDFIDHMQEDPYPVEVEGDFAAQKDITARAFDSEDDETFEKYYTALHEWVWHHTWHHASGGAILAHLYFQLIGDQVEISWNNRHPEDGVQFDMEFGCGYVPKEVFVDVVNHFLRDYADHWFQ